MDSFRRRTATTHARNCSRDMNSGASVFFPVPHRNWERVSTQDVRGHPSSGHTPKAVRSGAAQRTRGEKKAISSPSSTPATRCDYYIYAVEKPLDSYKFNLLQNKVFINSQSRNLAARTIDEGAIDENGGGSFSEYVAILSGNDDLLEKAKLDKKLAVLESERQAFHRNKGNAKGKLNERTSGIEKNNAFIGRFTRDWEYFNKVAPADTETGLRPNPLKLDGVDSDNVEILGNRLAAINRNARTEDDYMKIGTLFDFRILVRTERICDGDTQTLQNKFMVEGLDGIKYTYNNGYIAKDPKLAVMNFINALETHSRHDRETGAGKRYGAVEGHPVLQEIVAASWPKDAEIKRLNEELATLNRKIQLTIKPAGGHESGTDDGTEIKRRKDKRK